MFVLKIALSTAAVLTTLALLPSLYVSYKGIVTTPFTQNKDSDKLDEGRTCSLAVDKTQFTYDKSFCYRNIWSLAKKFKEEHPEELQYMYAVFTASINHVMPTWRQIHGKGDSGKLRYTYHVVLLYSKDKKSWIFDFDSTLKFPEELKSYCRQTFRTESIFRENFQPLFRVIRADTYLKTFNPYREGRILGKLEDAPIYKYINMVPGQSISERYGEVLDRFQFYERFAYAKKEKKE